MTTYDVFYSLEEKRKIEALAEHKIIMGWVPYRIAQQMKAQQSVKCPACDDEGPCNLCDETCLVTVPEAELWAKADLPAFEKLEIINAWRAKLSNT